MSSKKSVRQKSSRLIIGFIAFTLLSAVTAYGQRPPTDVQLQQGLPQKLRSVGIDQNLDGQLPLDLVFRDENGENVTLRKYFGEKPVILAPVYYKCPMLCNQVLNGLSSSLNILSFDAGKDFDVLAVSFDPRELPEDAAAKKQEILARYKHDGGGQGWHFLTGDQAAIDAFTKAIGFHYEFDPQINQFAHASGIMIATPEGKLARYFYGIDYAPKDVRLGLVEASESRIGSPVDALLLYCYHYDPATGKYGAVVMNMLRVGGVITLIIIAGMILLLKRRVTGGEQADIGGTA